MCVSPIVKSPNWNVNYIVLRNAGELNKIVKSPNWNVNTSNNKNVENWGK
nr:hypothetical protein [Peptoanaerobacter stomatis]